MGLYPAAVGEPYDEDVYVGQTQIRCFGLQSGDIVRGEVRPPRDAEKYYGLLFVKSINGQPPRSP